MNSYQNSTIIFRPTKAIVDLNALSHNYRVITDRLPRGVGVMAMVKADAYGHGAVQVAKVLERLNVRALGVATVEEGLELRCAGIQTQVLVMGGFLGVGSPASVMMVEANLTPVIHSSGVLDALETDATRAGKRIGVHLKLDTGMSRLGIRPEALALVLDKLKLCSHLYLEGVMTHLATAEDEEISRKQMDKFIEQKTHIETQLGKIPIWHIANSTALFAGNPVMVPDAGEVWARPGLSLYGSCNKNGKGLKPVMHLESRAVLLKHVPAGTRVSYGGTYLTKRQSRLAIVPIGYADGYPWSVSGKAVALIKGKRVPVAGCVTMDMIVLDVTDVPDVLVNDEVVLLGEQGDELITLNEFAKWADTIPYEILCGISKRMPRIYKETV